ncbi:hypothetical protein [Saccharibacillus deserti]|uniref:hypothetical protein n=1 Tax=Saccharibacillus deserti TaxID=1634444 RepID=UPI001557A0CA|nr:hypothetical protein [Saccharibacillus deserti]
MRILGRVTLVLILFLMSFGLLIPAEKAMACSCRIPETAREAKEKASAAFTGTVRKIEKFKDDRKEMYNAVTLAVGESWKGVNEPEVVVYTSWSSCQFDFEEGKRYLLYPYEYKGRYEVYNCGRSGEIRSENISAAADLKELGAGTKFEAPPEPEKEKSEGTGKRIAWIGIPAAILLLAAGFGLWQRRSRKKRFIQ